MAPIRIRQTSLRPSPRASDSAAAWSTDTRRMIDDLDSRTGPRYHVQGVRRFVKGQGVGLLHGWVTHLFDGNSGGQIVTNDNVRRGLGYPGQLSGPSQAVGR